MPQETEIKLRIDDVQAFRRALDRMGARQAGKSGRMHESNVLFDTPGQDLRKRGQLLRIRTEKNVRGRSRRRNSNWESVTLTLKRPVAGDGRNGVHKVRDEIEVRITDREALTNALQGLKMRPWFRYEKYRTTFRLPRDLLWAHGLLIELDETPIGTFAELEGPASAIDRAARSLGYTKRDYITKNYFVLYREYCRHNRAKLSNMVFAREK